MTDVGRSRDATAADMYLVALGQPLRAETGIQYHQYMTC